MVNKNYTSREFDGPILIFTNHSVYSATVDVMTERSTGGFYVVFIPWSTLIVSAVKERIRIVLRYVLCVLHAMLHMLPKINL